eukprot:GHVN01047707.1.p1 GENE.GHVN01047707.1~~GHVN01047707.1.p1  ORF type:complete len:1264 (-),score=336.48 GHVN01047707.1:96-3410(-)
MIQCNHTNLTHYNELTKLNGICEGDLCSQATSHLTHLTQGDDHTHLSQSTWLHKCVDVDLRLNGCAVQGVCGEKELLIDLLVIDSPSDHNDSFRCPLIQSYSNRPPFLLISLKASITLSLHSQSLFINLKNKQVIQITPLTSLTQLTPSPSSSVTSLTSLIEGRFPSLLLSPALNMSLTSLTSPSLPLTHLLRLARTPHLRLIGPSVPSPITSFDTGISHVSLNQHMKLSTQHLTRTHRTHLTHPTFSHSRQIHIRLSVGKVRVVVCGYHDLNSHLHELIANNWERPCSLKEVTETGDQRSDQAQSTTSHAPTSFNLTPLTPTPLNFAHSLINHLRDRSYPHPLPFQPNHLTHQPHIPSTHLTLPASQPSRVTSTIKRFNSLSSPHSSPQFDTPLNQAPPSPTQCSSPIQPLNPSTQPRSCIQPHSSHLVSNIHSSPNSITLSMTGIKVDASPAQMSGPLSPLHLTSPHCWRTKTSVNDFKIYISPNSPVPSHSEQAHVTLATVSDPTPATQPSHSWPLPTSKRMRLLYSLTRHLPLSSCKPQPTPSTRLGGPSPSRPSHPRRRRGSHGYRYATPRLPHSSNTPQIAPNTPRPSHPASASRHPSGHTKVPHHQLALVIHADLASPLQPPHHCMSSSACASMAPAPQPPSTIIIPRLSVSLAPMAIKVRDAHFTEQFITQLINSLVKPHLIYPESGNPSREVVTAGGNAKEVNEWMAIVGLLMREGRTRDVLSGLTSYVGMRPLLLHSPSLPYSPESPHSFALCSPAITPQSIVKKSSTLPLPLSTLSPQTEETSIIHHSHLSHQSLTLPDELLPLACLSHPSKDMGSLLFPLRSLNPKTNFRVLLCSVSIDKVRLVVTVRKVYKILNIQSAVLRWPAFNVYPPPCSPTKPSHSRVNHLNSTRQKAKVMSSRRLTKLRPSPVATPHSSRSRHLKRRRGAPSFPRRPSLTNNHLGVESQPTWFTSVSTTPRLIEIFELVTLLNQHYDINSFIHSQWYPLMLSVDFVGRPINRLGQAWDKAVDFVLAFAGVEYPQVDRRARDGRRSSTSHLPPHITQQAIRKMGSNSHELKDVALLQTVAAVALTIRSQSQRLLRRALVFGGDEAKR